MSNEDVFEALDGDDELSPEMEEVLSHVATAIVEGPSQNGKAESSGEATKDSREAAQDASKEEAIAKKVGTDAQEIPFDPGKVTVSRGHIEDAAQSEKQLLIQLVPGGHPVLTFEGKWQPRDVTIAVGSIMRGWRLYQITVQREQKNA